MNNYLSKDMLDNIYLLINEIIYNYKINLMDNKIEDGQTWN